MAFKFLAAFVLMAAAAVSAQQYVQQHLPIGAAVYHSAPAAVLHAHPAAVVHAAPVVQHVELEAPAKYAFSYSVHDSQTGDIKAQNEHRDGDNVQGSYSLVDADGLHRTVDYTADEVNGFNAVVRREPLAVAAHAVHAVPAVAVAHY